MPNLNTEEVFASLKERVAAELKAQFPFEGTKRRLELAEVIFDEKSATLDDPHHVDNLDEQFKARTSGMTWGVPVRGRLRLVEKATGNLIEEQVVTLIPHLPKLTKRYSYIIEGQERQHDSVWRSKPRPYHRIAASGRIEGVWNLAGHNGFDISYDPEKGRMLMTVGTSNIPLLSVLLLLGVSEAAIEAAWGSVVMQENRKVSNVDRDADKLFSALKLHLASRTTGTPAQRQERVREYFSKETEVWPDAMKAVFGKPYTSVTGDGLLQSSKRLLDIQKGRTKEDPPPHELPDDRQALSSKYLTTTEDFVVEAIRKNDYILRRQVRDKIDNPEMSITNIISPNVYKKVVLAPFSGAQRPDQMNPLQFLSGFMRTTIRGKDFGGVASDKINLDPDKEINPTHLGFLDAIQTPEGEDTGIALHLPLGINVSKAEAVAGRKSKVSAGQEVRTKVWDVHAEKMVLATPAELEHAVVAYPDQVRWVAGKPEPVDSAVVCYDEERKTSKRPWGKVRYVLPSAKALLSFSANLIPFLPCDNGNRAMMAAKQQEQAIALVHREVPLVQVKTDGSSTFEGVVGSFVSHTAPVGGVVHKVEPGAIHLKTDSGVVRVPIYNHFPLNGGKNSLHAEPVVKVGQSVEKGQLIADTNYTRSGTLAMGANLRVGYIPYSGLTFEDGVVLSESAAKRLSSDHLHAFEALVYPGMVGAVSGSKAKWANYALPDHKTADRLSKLDDRGIVREGAEVHAGDVLVAILSPRRESEEDKIAARIHKSLVTPFKDSSLVWDHEYSGKVVKVIVAEGLKTRVTVHVATAEPMVVGDKLSGRHGNKGIVARILPDHKMPHTADGAPLEVMLNPAGVPSRMNVGQVLETAASKIAEKTGKPYVIENFMPGMDYSAKVQADLKKHDLSDTEELFDAETGRSVGPVLVGKQYLLKLHHVVEKKQTARSFGTGYTHSGEAPHGSGIPGGGQKMDMLTTYAMLAHGARANLREAQTYKSDGDQHAVWTAVMTGSPLPTPQPTRGMANFLNYMRAMGINTEKKGDQYVLMPMTDAHLLGDPKRGMRGVSNGLIKLPEKLTVARGARTVEETGGLFDPRVTGGIGGKFWSHVELAERMPNPLFEGAIQVLTGMTGKEYNSLTGPSGHDGARSGFHEIVSRLSAIDVDKELEKERAGLGKLSRSALNRSLKRIHYLEALKENNLTPLEAYTNKYLPVLPPSIRRIAVGLDGKQVLDDRNGLYLAVGQANAQLKEADPSTPHADVQKARAQLYDSIKALRLTGTTSSVGGGKPRHFQGLMELLSGKTDGSGAPKESYFQEGVLARRQDLSGRSTIIPEPSLGLDEVGIPSAIAMEMYRPFVARELVRMGKDPLTANQWVTQKQDHPQVVSALQRAVAERPVMLKRDPALHKFSIMGFKPKVVSGKAIQIHPLVCKGFGADFDGDTMALYVPVSAQAVDEVHRMLPSQNLFSTTHYGLMNVPSQDSLVGLFQASKWGAEVQTPPGLTAARAVQMMEDGKLKPTDVVEVGGKKTTPGRIALASHLPPEMAQDQKLLYDPAFRLDDKGLQAVLSRVGKEHEKSYPLVVDAWKDLGNKMAFLHGSSFSIQDFHDGKHFRDEILRKYRVREQELHGTPMSSRKRDHEIVKLYTEAQAELKQAGMARYNAGDNRVWEWARSGARGGWGQFSQLTVAPVLVEDPRKKAVPIPILKSFGEGLSVSEYWASMHGARKGTLDKAQGTREPGAVSKDILNTTMNIQITGEDCGATEGVHLPPSHNDVVDRFLVKSVRLPDGKEIPAGALVTTALVAQLRAAEITEIVVRSPLFCRMPRGICATCFGHSEKGHLHHVGTNIGVIAGQALGEPMTQLSMKCNAAGNLLRARFEGEVYVLTFEQLWDRMPSTVMEEGGVETKVTPGLEVWDYSGFVRAYSLQRHLPEDRMLLARTENGLAFVSQGNHPNWGRLAAPTCPYCGESEPVQFIGHWREARGKPPRTSVSCERCGAPFMITREEYEQQQERIVPTEGLEDVLIGTCAYSESYRKMPLPPYLLGMFMAEGCIRREQKDAPSFTPGRKRRALTPHGLKWTIQAAQVSQNPGEIRERILEEMQREELPYFETGDVIEISSVEIAERLAADCGFLSSGKCLPPGFLAQPSEWAALFLAGYLDGDGTCCADSPLTCFDTTSWALASQVLMLLRRFDSQATVYACTTYEGKNKHQPYRVTAALPFRLPSVKQHPICEDSYQQQFGYSPVVQVKEVMYEGLVYDVRTESHAFSANGIRTHNTFHTGGTVGTAGKIDAFKRVKQLFSVPDKLPDAAAIATVTGKVEKVVVDPRGGHTITVAGVEHRAVTGQLLGGVKVGETVAKGDALATGPVNPRELLQHTKSIGRARNYMASELAQAYGNMTRRRNIEVVVRGMTNLTEVHDAPKESPFIRGELAPLSEVEAYNAEAEADGRDSVSHTPKLRAMTQVPLSATEDWLARLNYQHLKDTYIEGAAAGWKSDIHGSPVAGLAHGAEFGLRPPQALKAPPQGAKRR